MSRYPPPLPPSDDDLLRLQEHLLQEMAACDLAARRWSDAAERLADVRASTLERDQAREAHRTEQAVLEEEIDAIRRKVNDVREESENLRREVIASQNRLAEIKKELSVLKPLVRGRPKPRRRPAGGGLRFDD